MAREAEWEFPSLEWIHRVREEHYRQTKDLPLGAWLRPVNQKKAVQACRRLGLKAKPGQVKKRKTG